MPIAKRVLFIVTKGSWGGAQRYVFDVATGLAARNYEVSVAAGGGSELLSALSKEGVRTVKLVYMERDFARRGEWRAFRELFKIIRAQKPDILHLNSSKAGLLGALAGRILRVPRIVFTAHGWASEESRPWRERVLFLGLHWLTVLLSHCTIAVSEHTRRHLKWFPFASRKMITVHNGISIGAKLSRAASWELLIKRISVLAAHYTSYRIVSIAELHPNKGLDVALEGLAALGSVPWVLVIMGEGQLRQELERRIQELGLHGQVILAGRVPRAAQYLPAFDLFLLPSRKEGLPYVLLEAGAAELPVLATSVGGIPELIRSMKNGILIDPEVPEAVTGAVRIMAADPKKCRQFGARLKERVGEAFSTETMLEGVIHAYEGV